MSIDVREAERFRAARPEVFEDVLPATLEVTSRSTDSTPLLTSSSNLCFVMMPFRSETEDLYRSLIKPVVEQHGLVALRADEIFATGLITEQIRVAIQQSRLCVADMSGRNSMFCTRWASPTRSASQRFFLTQDFGDVPFDLRTIRHIQYRPDALEAARADLERAIKHILGEDRLDEAERLVAAGMHRAAAGCSRDSFRAQLSTPAGALREHASERSASAATRTRPGTSYVRRRGARCR